MREMQLTKGYVALVSDEDYDFLSQWKWQASNESRGTKWYAIRWSQKSEHGEGKRYKIRMHRVVMELFHSKKFLTVGTDTSGVSFIASVVTAVVDHKNGNSLDNRRENLEVVSQEENMNRVQGWKGSRTFNENREPSL